MADLVELMKKKENLTEKQITHKKIEEILKEYDFRESEIPLNHEYWSVLTKYRSMKDGR